MSQIPQKRQNNQFSEINNNEEYLDDLYAYFQEQQQQQENNQDVYSGCDYQNDYFDQQNLVQEFSYQDESEDKQGSRTNIYRPNQLLIQTGRMANSQPVSNVRNKLSQQNKILQKNESIKHQSQHLSQHQQPSNNRSLNALVSASKKRHNKPKKTLSQRSTSTTKSFATKNKILQAQKEKRKNGDNSIEPLFLNPFTSLPTETMNIQAFQKFYKIDYQNLLAKTEQIYKKISVLGEKAFFKDKSNEALINEVFQLMGIKNSTKLGKGRALRELKAVYKYMSISNPQNSQQKLVNLDQNVQKLQPSYLASFKQMLGYSQPQNQKNSSNKKGLEKYGFQKLERKH